MISANVLADTASRYNTFGIDFKRINIDAAEHNAIPSTDDLQSVNALTLSVAKRINPHLSIRAEIDKGVNQADSTYRARIASGQTLSGEEYTANLTTKLNYAIRALAKLRLSGNESIDPYFSLGMNTASVNYDLSGNGNLVLIERLSGDKISSGFMYGAGLEIKATDNLHFSLAYERIPHLKAYSAALQFDIAF